MGKKRSRADVSSNTSLPADVPTKCDEETAADPGSRSAGKQGKREKLKRDKKSEEAIRPPETRGPAALVPAEVADGGDLDGGVDGGESPRKKTKKQTAKSKAYTAGTVCSPGLEDVGPRPDANGLDEGVTEIIGDGITETYEPTAKTQKKSKRKQISTDPVADTGALQTQNGALEDAAEETIEDDIKEDSGAGAEAERPGKIERNQTRKGRDEGDDGRRVETVGEEEVTGQKKQKKAKKDRPKKGIEQKLEEKEDMDGKRSTASCDANGIGSMPAYTQSPALDAVPQAEVDAFIESKNISIMDPSPGAIASRPILRFAQLPASTLLATSPFTDFADPTPIQAATWPYTLAGRDLIGVAETGSGKTMAFAFPCVERLSRATVAAPAKRTPRAVVVSPTRELALQTHGQLAGLAARVGLRAVCLFGGAAKGPQRAQLQAGTDVVVATPGRLRDFMADGTVDLAAAGFVVLDEADRMLDRGFEADIRHILSVVPPVGVRQTLMFTATWPESVQGLAASLMREPVRVTVSTSSRAATAAAAAATGVGGSTMAGGAVELQANSRIAQEILVVEAHGKEARLLQLIRRHQQRQPRDRILVFCLYKKEATRVEGFLAGRGISVTSLHGDLPQEKRTSSLEAFRSGRTTVLVATDVAARGLDISDVKLVINVTFPLTIEDYVHRIGRTGRAGQTGRAITFFTVHDKAHSGALMNVLRAADQPVPDELLKFGATVKKKLHPTYGAFYREIDHSQPVPQKIVFEK